MEFWEEMEVKKNNGMMGIPKDDADVGVKRQNSVKRGDLMKGLTNVGDTIQVSKHKLERDM